MTAQVIDPCPASSSSIHRDQDQIRSRLLHSLGIFPGASVNISSICISSPLHHEGDSVTKSMPASSNKEEQRFSLAKSSFKPCSANHRQESLKYKTEDIAPKDNSRVSFVDVVSVVEIPSHREYGDAIKQDLWNGLAQLAASVQRNSLEFQSEGYNWQNCLEEHDFVRLPSGELMHPTTYNKRQQRLAHEKRMKKKKQMKKEGGYKSIAACLSFPTHNYSAPKKRATTATKSGRKTVVRGKKQQPLGILNQ